jgi:flagellar biosynthesis/type III secretory pathway M-ring protein FliF/YscJ
MVRTNQGGSVLGFIVVGIVMLLLLVGGIHVVRQQLTQPEQVQDTANQSQGSDDQQEEGARQDNQSDISEQANSPEDHPFESTSNTASELPQTGPVELFGTLLALGLLGGVAVSYLRSRRPELSL